MLIAIIVAHSDNEQLEHETIAIRRVRYTAQLRASFHVCVQMLVANINVCLSICN